MDGSEFLLRMRKGDATVWDDLMPMLRGIVFGACNTLRIHDNLKEDIFQDVSLRVFSKWESYHEASALSTWVYSIARNRCLDELRKRKVRGDNFCNPESSGQNASEDTASSEQPSYDPKFELMLCVQQVLAELSEQGPARRNSHRTIDVLLYWVEHSPTMDDLAQYLGKPSANAAKQRIYEMRKQLEQLCHKFCGHQDCSLQPVGSEK